MNKRNFKSTAIRIFFMVFVVLFSLVLLTACGTKKKPKIPEITKFPVVTQGVSGSKSIISELSFPAILNSSEQAKIYAKASGTAKNIFYGLGQDVKAGELLIKIDDVTGTSYGTDFNAGPVNQAKIASDQAAVNYRNAVTVYQNLLSSSQNDLKQTEIAKTQAETGAENTQSIADDTFKTAQIAYDSAKIAAEQANTALDDRKAIAQQSMDSAKTNAELASTSVINSGNTILTGINNVTGFDESNSVVIPYKSYLGAYDQKTYNNAFNIYKDTKAYYDDFVIKSFEDEQQKVSNTILLAQKIKDLVDSVKLLLDNSVSGALLPLSSPTGVSLTGLQSTVASYQAQINAALAQINSADQMLSATSLNNSSTLDSMEKAYELAKQQEKTALQNLDNIQNSIKNQLDQAEFGKQQASNAYEGTKIKLDTQISAAKAQADSARLQYENSLIALNNLTSNYEMVSPISGTITQKFVSEGDTVSPGQLIFVISGSNQLKAQFYVDFETMQLLKVGDAARFQTTDGRTFGGKITALSSGADDMTKRFLVEAIPDFSGITVASGTVADVYVTAEIRPSYQSNILLPLSSITFGQNKNTIFINDNGRAKQIEVNVVKIIGENAEVNAVLPDDALIVIGGNQFLHEGDFLTEQ